MQTTFVNTLLQDITIFNGNNSSQLEDWLTDIETAVDLTSVLGHNLGCMISQHVDAKQLSSPTNWSMQ